MKKLTAFLTAITILSVCVSCSSEKSLSKAEPQSFIAETISRTYKRSRSELPKELNAVYRMTPYKNGEKVFILGGSLEKTPVFYTADSELENFSVLDIPDFITGNSYDLDISPDGSVTAVSVTGGEDEEYKILVSRFSENGEIISSNEISGIYDTVPPENAMITGVYSSSDGKYFIFQINGEYYSADTDGNFIGKLNSDCEIEQFGKDSDGNIICMLDLGDSRYKICTVNPENLSLNESVNEYTFNDGIVSGIIPAYGDYSMYIPCRKNIYAIKKDGSAVPVFDVSSSGLNANTLSDFLFDKSGTFIIPENDYSGFSVKMVRYQAMSLITT